MIYAGPGVLHARRQPLSDCKLCSRGPKQSRIGRTYVEKWRKRKKSDNYLIYHKQSQHSEDVSSQDDIARL